MVVMDVDVLNQKGDLNHQFFFVRIFHFVEVPYIHLVIAKINQLNTLIIFKFIHLLFQYILVLDDLICENSKNQSIKQTTLKKNYKLHQSREHSMLFLRLYIEGVYVLQLIAYQVAI